MNQLKHTKRSSNTRRRLPLGALACGVLAYGALAVAATGQEPHRLDRFKAVFMYNFVDYVAWPDSSDSLFTFGILGESPITQLLREIAERKSAESRRLGVSVFGRIDEALSCDMLFVSAAFAPRMEELKRALGNSSVLTIADTPGLGAGGVAINFYVSGERLKFEINRASLKRAGLHASSQLLKLATLVDDGNQAVQR